MQSQGTDRYNNDEGGYKASTRDIIQGVSVFVAAAAVVVKAIDVYLKSVSLKMKRNDT